MTTRRPTTDYRRGIHTPQTREAHRLACRDQRRRRAAKAFGEAARAIVLAALTDGATLRKAAQRAGATLGQIYGLAAWHTEWSSALDAALDTGCDPALNHGTPGAYKHGGRCRACRTAGQYPRTARYGPDPITDLAKAARRLAEALDPPEGRPARRASAPSDAPTPSSADHP